MLTLFICALLFQKEEVLQRGTTPPLEQWMMTNPNKIRAMPEPGERSTELQQYLFEHRFNHLIDTLRRFGYKYNEGQGNVWPFKEAEAVRKAYRDLERSMVPKRQTGGHPGTTNPDSDSLR